jgi:DNA repair photolyase
MELVKLVGIARLAAEGTTLVQKRRVEYRTLPTRKLLNRCHSQRVPFQWTINPYRGCEFGCKYCYARYTHDYMERREPEAFETEIYVKDWDAESFTRELRVVKPGEIIGIGTATDPYQPVERKLRRTRELLECLACMRGITLFITTKSNLVTRDIDLLKAIARANSIGVTLTVTTMNRDLARLTEPFAPHPEVRMKAVAELAAVDISVGVIASPVLPLITDSEENLESVARAAKAAGARQFGAQVLFLQPTTQKVFFPFVAERFPKHLRRYERSFAAGAYLKGSYPARIRQLIRDIRGRVGIENRDMELMSPPPVSTASPESQMLLF